MATAQAHDDLLNALRYAIEDFEGARHDLGEAAAACARAGVDPFEMGIEIEEPWIESIILYEMDVA